jgi:hypothetical protein
MIRFKIIIIVLFISFLVLSVSSSCKNEEDRIFYQTNVCNLHKNIGSCKLKWKRFYYNKVTRTCEPFFYEGNILYFKLLCQKQENVLFSFSPSFYSILGCNSNRNNFKTLAECEACCG